MALEQDFPLNPWLHMKKAFDAFKAESPEESHLLKIARHFTDISADGVCFLCRQLPLKEVFQRELRREDEDLEWHLGILSDLIQRQQCRICAFFVAVFERQIAGGKLPTRDVDSHFITVRLKMPTVNLRVLELRHDLRGSKSEDFGAYVHEMYVLSLFDKHNMDISSPPVSLSQHTDRKFDIGVARTWLETCKGQHSSCRLHPATYNTIDSRPPMVLDVHKLCVVSNPLDADYAALSYVWGGIAVPRPQAHKNGFCVDYSSIEQLLPLTIRHAIHLVSMIGIQYLWVDSLCIDQSDPKEVESQVSRMDVFYESAALTVIAAAGEDSAAGLPGIGTLPRGPLLLTETLGDLTLTTKLTKAPTSFISARIEESKWNTRGWCFQERAFSRRCLIFTPLLVFFFCRSNSWYEYDTLKGTSLGNMYNTENPSGLPQQAPQNFGALLPTQQSLFHRLYDTLTLSTKPFPWSQYGALVSRYSAKDFTYGSDVLRALQGATRRLSDAYRDRIIWGLPLSCFDLAVCWIPRRGGSGVLHFKQICRGPRRRNFPSWSWASWDGNVEYLGDFNAVKVVTWYILHSDGEVTHIRSRIVLELNSKYEREKRLPEAEIRNLILTPSGRLSQQELQDTKQKCGPLYADISNSLGEIGGVPEGICFYIVFKTASAFFSVVADAASNPTQPLSLVGCNLVDRHGKIVSLFPVTLEYPWYLANQSKPVECVCVGAHVDTLTGEVKWVKVMLLGSRGLFDVRIGLCWISRDDWCAAEDRKERLVIIG
jgi:hypothetical protein